MARRRQRVVAAPATVRFCSVPTARVLKLEVDHGGDMTGSFVKLTPRLRRSERSGFDAAAAVAELKARGAVAAVAAPVVIPDDIAARVDQPTAVEHIDARAELNAWFGEQPDNEHAAALRTCLRILDQVGF